MAFLGSPPVNDSGDWVNLPDDVYEAVVVDVQEVPNDFYNPDTDNDSKKTQFQWDIRVRKQDIDPLPALNEGERYSDRLRMWTGSALGRHPKNKLTNTVRVIDKEFDIERGYSSFDDFRNRVVSQPVRVIVKTPVGKTYAKIEGVMPSRSGAIPMAELIQLGVITTDSDLPPEWG